MPIPIIAAIGAVASAAGSAFGAAKSAQANKRARLYLDDYDRDSQNRANYYGNMDYTQTATAQNGLTNLRRIYLDDIQSMHGQRIVGGGNAAEEARAKQQANDSLAQGAGNIVANGETMANQARQQRASEKQWVAGQRVGLETKAATNAAQAGANFASNMGNFISGLAQDEMDKANTTETSSQQGNASQNTTALSKAKSFSKPVAKVAQPANTTAVHMQNAPHSLQQEMGDLMKRYSYLRGGTTSGQRLYF